MWIIVSTIGTSAYGISKYLVQIIQPILNKSDNKFQNSTSFVHEANNWKTEPNEIQLSYDVVDLYPSVSLDRSIQFIWISPRWLCRIEKEGKIKSNGYSTTPRIMFNWIPFSL